jgi:uncharacterized protein YjbI with pentapeptide repeats
MEESNNVITTDEFLKMVNEYTEKGYVPDFEGKNLEGLHLSDTKIKDVNFHNANLEGAVFKNVEFVRCTFDGAKLDHVQWNNVDFYFSSFLGALMRETTIVNTKFSKLLLGMDFTGSTLRSVSFYDARLRGSVFDQCNMDTILFLNGQLQYSSIRNATMKKINLFNANLLYSDLSGTTIEHAGLYKTIVKTENLLNIRHMSDIWFDQHIGDWVDLSKIPIDNIHYEKYEYRVPFFFDN